MKKLQIVRTSPSHSDLINLYKKEKNARVKERYQALFLMHELQNCANVAEGIKRSSRTVEKWINAFNKGGINAIIPKKQSGRPSRLSKSQKEELKQDILTHPRKLGYDFSNWTGKSVAHHVKKKFNVSLKIRRCQELLHELGLTLQRPRRKFVRVDLQKQADFIEAFKKKMTTRKENDIFLFQDECSVLYAPTITRMWSLKGQQPEILTCGSRKRIVLLGTVNPFSGELFTAFTFKTIKAPQFQQFLEGIIARHPQEGKIYLFTDNAPPHVSHELEPFLKLHEDKFELVFFPKYSPELNPQEKLWNKLRSTVTHNTFFETFNEFHRQIILFFKRFKTATRDIISLCKLSNLFNAL